MANIEKDFVFDTGKTLRLFPDRRYGVSPSTWGSNAKVATEQSSPNHGTYDVTLDDTYRYWMGFEGSGQPANWGLWQFVLDIYDGKILADDLDPSALAKINQHRKG